MLHEVSDGGGQLLPGDRRHPRRLHEELGLVVSRRPCRRRDALHLRAGVQHVVHGQLEAGTEVTAKECKMIIFGILPFPF